jgi:hypothetical protein
MLTANTVLLYIICRDVSLSHSNNFSWNSRPPDFSTMANEKALPSAGDGSSRRKSGIRGFSLAKEARTDGKIELTERDAWEATAYAFSTRKKWTILSVIFTVQMSMNFNTSVYPSVVPLLAEHYNVSEQAARVGQMIFLVTYAFGCELWAPYSEEFGRW